MALIELVDKITNAFSKKFSAIGVVIDLFKAFDTLDHYILISKLNHYGISRRFHKTFPNLGLILGLRTGSVPYQNT